MLGTCRPVTTEKLPFHTCRGRHSNRQFKKKKDHGAIDLEIIVILYVSHHESWYNWLLELGFEGVHQLFSFGIVERQHTWRE